MSDATELARVPRFFVDRSLGRVRLPALLRADGWLLLTLAEHYGIPRDETVLDVEWLELAGSEGWPVLMKDDRIRYRPAEAAALVRHRVVAFSLAGGNLRAENMADLFIKHKDAIWAAAETGQPAIYVVSRLGLRRVEL